MYAVLTDPPRWWCVPWRARPKAEPSTAHAAETDAWVKAQRPGNIGTLAPRDCRVAEMASSTQGPPRRTDEDLMDAFRGGDAEAFEQLVERHGRSLYNFLLRSVRTPHRAEELLQEVMLRVVKSKGRYQRSAKFTTWVYTIARNLTVDESRRGRFRDHDSLDAPLRGRNGDGSGRTRMCRIAAEQVPTDMAAEAPRLRGRLRAAIDQLPEDQREVFLMRQVSGMSFREIGDVVGAPENTVKSRMRYALEKLRHDLADLDPAGPALAREPAQGAKEGLVHG
jgi:RNA polymerase sigma-70 factor (ECF subfamily)